MGFPAKVKRALTDDEVAGLGIFGRTTSNTQGVQAGNSLMDFSLLLIVNSTPSVPNRQTKVRHPKIRRQVE
jgi:hypothetical protein